MSKSILYELSDEVLVNSRKNIKFKARGSSMRPYIRDGDIVEIEPVDEFEDIDKGDILLFNNGNAVCLHRVIGFSNGRFTIKGDSSRYIDGEINEESIIGKLLSIERNGNQRKINNNWINKIASYSWIWYRFLFIIKKLLKPILRPIHSYLLSISPVRSTLRNCFRNRMKTSLAEPSDAYDICMFYQIFNHQEINDTRKNIYNKESYYIISKLFSRIIGIVMLHYDDREEPWNGWWLIGFHVRNLFRGIGSGQAMIKQAIITVSGIGGTRIKLLAFKERKPARLLYEKFEFKRVINSDVENQLDEEVKHGISRRILMVKRLDE